MTSVHDPLVGHALDGRYDITERLARGGMATVYRAIDRRLGREVAIKVMHEGLGDDNDFARKFDREARAAARLSNPHVVSVFDQGTDNGRPYIVMEYVPGMTLRQVIVRDAPMEPLRVLGLIEPVLAALASAHEAGIVHRDMKPENVLISDRGQLKVADFGLARAITSQSATATQGILIGTVSYLPPELVMGQRADTRSDVYSVGVMIWEMLTGRKPHTGETPIQVAYAHVHEDIPAVSENSTMDIPAYVDALVRSATHRDPDQRPTDAQVLLDMVREAREALATGTSHREDLETRFTTARSTDRSTRSRSAASAPDTNRAVIDSRRTERGAPVTDPDEQDSGIMEHTPTDRSWPPVRISQDVTHRRRRRLIGMLLLVLLLVGGSSWAGWWFTSGRWTTAPALTGMTADAAQQTATAADVTLTFNEAFSETVPKGQIISTDPTAEERVVRGTTVEAVVSLGPERFEVPTLVGLTRDEATQALSEVQLTVGKVTEQYDEKAPAGQVLAASQDPGARVKRNTPVDLTVSKGRQPIAIGDWTGKKSSDAVASLKKSGFTVTVTKQHSRTVAAGLVVSQTPKSTTGYRGDTITIVESLGPVMVTVPNVKSMGVKQATAVLKEKGFDVTTEPVKENYLGLGYVSYAEPGFGSKAPEGSTIVLYLV